MQLIPRRPPGRLNRKALAFVAEIGRLHAEGYTSEAIRQTLLDAGLSVSRRTVQREVHRYVKSRHVDKASVESSGVSLDHPSRHVAAEGMSPFASDPRTSKEIAADFVRGRITNPLLRSRSS